MTERFVPDAERFECWEHRPELLARTEVIHVWKDSPIAKYAPGLRSIKLYRDGRIEYRGHTGSVVGAAPGVDTTGSKRLIRDTREVFLTIEGPSVGISAPL